jgi:hypothetical protein
MNSKRAGRGAMPYIFDLQSKPLDVPFVDVFDVSIVEFALGYDVEADVVVLMSVMLLRGASYLDSRLDDAFDLRFGIRERDLKHEWKVSAPDFTRESSDRYVPTERRKDVMSLLCKSVQMLIKHSDAKLLTMETFYAHLPDKALMKYRTICSFLETCGFDLQDEFRAPDNGKNYWFLSSIPIEPVAYSLIPGFHEESVMTREQIIQMTRETGRLAASGKVGIAPRSAQHLARLEELKAARKLESAAPVPSDASGQHDD